jgi:predicted nucleotidyltransferase
MLRPKSIEYIRTVAKRYGAEKVLLFGSCLEKPEEEANDIDLAVYGLPPGEWLHMLNDLMWADELNGKSVDLVSAESQAPVLIYAREGKVIYEREPQLAGFSR